MNYERLAREEETASTAGTAHLAGNMLNTKTSRNAMVMTVEERKKKKAEYHKRYYHEHRDEILSKSRERRTSGKSQG